MKKITTKKDAEKLMSNFSKFASYDAVGEKYYFSFKDKDRGGKWTLMFYEKENTWSIHGLGENYCDDGETILDAKLIITFLYKNRKYVNSAIKEQSKLAASV